MSINGRLPGGCIRLYLESTGESDFTSFLQVGKVKDLDEYFEPIRNAESVQLPLSYSNEVHLKNETKPSRGLACPCFRNQFYSVTIRRAKEKKPAEIISRKRASITAPDGAKNTRASERQPSRTAYSLWPKKFSREEIKSINAKEPVEFVFELADCKEAIWELISKSLLLHRAGLVIVAGATSGGKSEITRGLIDEYLQHILKEKRETGKKRNPHLVTYEDPIEVLLTETPEEAQTLGLDFTPRQKGIDAWRLRDVLQDCLRQTPAAVYIGETRDRRDWPLLVNFAGSGHVVFTTCHAGSLVELITAVLGSVNADTKAKRSVVASRLLAVVHLKTIPITWGSADNPRRASALLPALWLRTPAAINAITAEGPSVVLPHAPHPDRQKDVYCYGRAYFANTLLKPKMRDKTPWGMKTKLEAFARDLEGL
jgi:type IV secretory pathway ATPase VirB11/archaellum biosynthesis ATPase